MDIKINDVTYAVGTASVSRSIRRKEKYRVTTEDGVTHREVQASYLDFSLSLGNLGQAAYDSLMEMLRSTTDDVSVELPRSATVTEVYSGTFDSISDEIINDDGTEVIWDNLSLSFTGTVPVEV